MASLSGSGNIYNQPIPSREVTVVYSVLPQLEAVLVGREIFSLVQTQTTQLELVNQVVLVEEVQGEIALLVILTQTLEVERVVKETLAV